MTELRVIIDIDAGIVEKVQLLAADAKGRSLGVKAYEALDKELERFSQKVAKLLRVARACGKL